MVLEHNMSTAFATRHLNITHKSKGLATEKLTSGYRINKAADNAASVSVIENMRGQIRGLEKAGDNAMDGQSLIATADAGMSEIGAILHRMKELCVQAANDTNASSDREDINKEIEALNSEIDRIRDETEFNKINIFQESANGEDIYSFQVGANSSQLINVEVPVLGTDVLGTDNVDISDAEHATKSIQYIDDAINILDAKRSLLGAASNRLDRAYANAMNSSECTQKSESKIHDTNYGDEMIKVSTANIKEEAGIAMIVQSNSSRETVLHMIQ